MKWLSVLGVVLFIAAGVAVFAYRDVLIGTALFFTAWGVWFAGQLK